MPLEYVMQLLVWQRAITLTLWLLPVNRLRKAVFQENGIGLKKKKKKKKIPVIAFAS